MSCVYVLLSEKTGKRYVGSSHENIPDIRLRAHNAGKTSSTKAGRPWKLIHTESCEDFTEARKRENWLKSGTGREYLDKLFETRRRDRIVGLVRRT
ncbi:MAG: GIY-YIG nuclease family protein [Candidatus Paceibacterota bacterium]